MSLLSLLFRTAGAWGAGKGAKLTAAEVDGNFYSLQNAVNSLVADPVQPVEIANITSADGQLTIHMADGGTYGPFPLPALELRWRDVWAPNTEYAAGDMFKAPSGTYLVFHPFTSGDTFIPGLSGVQGRYAELVIPVDDHLSIGFAAMGAPGAGVADGGLLFAFLSDRDFYLPAALPDTLGSLAVPPVSDLDFPIVKNGEPIGSFKFWSGNDAPVFTFESDVAFEPGDVLGVVRPETLDSAASTLLVTFAAMKGVKEEASEEASSEA